jgi:phage-related protein
MVHCTSQDTMARLKKLPASFFESGSGNQPVREWLLAMDEEDRRVVGYDIATAEFAWPVGMPLCRSLGSGLWEIRSNISSGRVARIIFAVVDEQMVLLHGFIKKTRKTPKPELNLALNRKKEITS